MNISGQEYKKLTDALIDAFPDKVSLEQMLLFELNKSLDNIALGKSLQEIVFNLIKKSKAEHWIDNLISAACNSNPGNSSLKAIAEELSLNSYIEKQENRTKINNLYVDKLEYPDGCVPLNSPFYIERNNIKSCCFQTLVQPGSLVRIKAPKLMGKTSLLRRILAYGQEQNYQTVYLDLRSIEKAVFSNLDGFLRWICTKVSLELELDNNVDNTWNTNILGSNDNCTSYFKKYILKQINTPLVLCLDEVDRLFPYGELVEDFFGMLRSWHEKGKISDVWKQMRLVLAHSTEVYVPLDYNQSPFNAGVPVELKELNQQQVVDLAQRHEINLNNAQLEELNGMLGGHPYLLRLAMYHMITDKVTLEGLLQKAATEEGIYINHLRDLLNKLSQGEDLRKAFKQVVNSNLGVELDSFQIYKLHSLGLVQRENNHVTPRCQLYRDYFRRVL
ncbi:AAA-like domain-containing protein [Mastigocoleus sp. MO_188.B34]|uniref:AAA-like domain-containing protein n=1 Tax=Mastigocoleus sp. MO_188.B34 TaxID=3036635 RepID=UPI0026058DA7|nr:AAA-like domain-containing protein [Mastigocoleus sp. MO_188.B34]MDJ0692847.1 AAA-like domain-containing protein [Mastigocoleus sp. MO_188.B34]